MPFPGEVPPSFLLTGEGELSIIISIVNAPPMGRAVRRERIILAQEILMTADGFAAMKQELEELKTTKRKEISEKIRVARGFGDLSENSEYDEAKNEQAVVEARSLLLEEQLKQEQEENQELSSQLSDQEKASRAMDWFWQINEAYVLGRYSLCRDLIQELQDTGLVDYLPKESVTDNGRFSPSGRYQEIYDALY